MGKPSGEKLSDEVMSELQQAYPQVQTGRWRDAVLGAFLLSSRKHGIPSDFVSMIKSMRFEPDGFVVSKSERFIDFFEVEVYNPMTSDKLAAYARFCFDLEYYEVQFSVLVTNKYGHINQVDLDPYMRWLPPTAPPQNPTCTELPRIPELR